MFAGMNDAEKQRLLAELLNLCNSQQLAFVQEFVGPRLKRDPFSCLPDELCLRVRFTLSSRCQHFVVA
jgi:F-box and WD-40 domain protein CDC4